MTKKEIKRINTAIGESLVDLEKVPDSDWIEAQTGQFPVAGSQQSIVPKSLRSKRVQLLLSVLGALITLLTALSQGMDVGAAASRAIDHISHGLP